MKLEEIKITGLKTMTGEAILSIMDAVSNAAINAGSPEVNRAGYGMIEAEANLYRNQTRANITGFLDEARRAALEIERRTDPTVNRRDAQLYAMAVGAQDVLSHAATSLKNRSYKPVGIERGSDPGLKGVSTPPPLSTSH